MKKVFDELERQVRRREDDLNLVGEFMIDEYKKGRTKHLKKSLEDFKETATELLELNKIIKRLKKILE